MPIPLFQVDAFTERPFAGNPAAVCLLSAWPEDRWLQSVAAEMNLSETAFVLRTPDGFHLRWCTPTVEVALCGHATLATAHVLWQEGWARKGEVLRFNTLSGPLRATPRGEEIELDFPLKPEEEVEAPPALAEALGAPFCYVGRNGFDYLVEVDTEATLRGLRPDMRLLSTLPVRGVIVTSRSAEPAYDFVSRFFAPASGVDEDPVTGSAHCCLGAFWRKRLNQDDFVAFQASARGGVVRVSVRGDRALLAGRAVTVASGSLLV